ncbi:mitochondrial ribosomal protein MRP51 [Hypoxylon sp. FL1857]|nr:mitochondrial ribosomal protein MRP51 [Hypoxylon sp. FL1857]
MAGRSVSPGAALLRSSRMFSMPAPIPAPPGDYSAATKHYSPTATINHPTHLTVTTTSSSRINGDWGFKRPFPLKTTTDTTYPLARVRQVDSIEHITDYQSASDHTITLRKFQELHLPINVPAKESYQARYSPTSIKNPTSVFEEDSDVTALDEQQKAELANKRWKFTGPWLAGMTDGDFNKFLEKKVRGRRPEFRAFLKKNLAAEMTADRIQKATEAGEATEPPEVSASDITDAQLTDYLRELREERMTLYNLVSQFLDLAPIDLDTEYRLLGKLKIGKPRVLDRSSPYGADGPPITHPSAGISYLRTRNFMENHPVYGPQKHHAPVEARVLKPTNHATHNFRPSIGIAGFVGSPGAYDTSFNTTKLALRSKLSKALNELDLEKHGGSKVYVQPTAATVDSSGNVCITIEEADGEAESIQKELVGEATVFEDELKAMKQPEVPRNPKTARPTFSPAMGSRTTGSASSYGLGRNFGL